MPLAVAEILCDQIEEELAQFHLMTRKDIVQAFDQDVEAAAMTMNLKIPAAAGKARPLQEFQKSPE